MESQEKPEQQDLRGILDREYTKAIERAERYSTWYETNRTWVRTVSRVFRGCAILAVAVGTLCPLIDAAYASAPSSFGQWGYVAFALSAALVGADRFFGLSSSWMRYMVARLELSRVQKNFHFEWTRLIADLQDRPLAYDQFEVRLKAIESFTTKVDEIVKQETENWISEFQRSLSELAKAAKAELKAGKPGDLKLMVRNAASFEKISAVVAGRERDFEGSSILLNDLPPGRYEVKISGQKGQKTLNEVEVVEITPNALSKLEMTLPEAS